MIRLSGYVVHELIRETVHSRVYRATGKSDSRAVVVKVARESSHEIHAAAHQELAILRKLDELATVHGIELEYFEDHPALVMELFPGAGLDEWLAGKPMALDAFLEVATAIASALDGIHARGVIHRDLKPANILINSETREICIADFGVSASLDGAISVHAAAMVGSLAYLSPEQTGRMNRMVDSRSDLYSLGVTFYEMITGKLPFEQTSPLELVHAHLALPPRSPSEIDAQIPAVVSELIGKLLAKGPDDRYQSAHGVAADLRAMAARLAAGQSLDGFTPGRGDRARTLLLPRKLYGRTAELALLERCLAGAKTGRVELLAVGGQSGSGKTALFLEAERELVVQRGHFIKGKFDRLARNVPFSAIAQAIGGLVDQFLARSDRELAAVRDDLLRELAGLGQVMVEIAPAVAKLIGPQPAVPAIGVVESQARTAEVFWRFVGAIATREHPLVMVLDDLQWADSGSLLLLEALTEPARHGHREVALLLLCAYRDNELPADHPLRALLDRTAGDEAEPTRAVHQLALAALEVDHVAELLSDTLHAPQDRVSRLAATVFRKTGGNAFFVHQFLKHAHRLGLFQFVDSDGWQWDEEAIKTAGVPADAAGLMTEKIRSLTPAVRTVLVDASVIGDELDLSTLLAITEAADQDALRAVHALLEEGLIVRAGARYRFAHDKIREAALGLCTDDRASRLHVAVGRHHLAALDGADAGAQIFAIADHLNHGHHHLASAERIAVAGLNLQAAKQALGVGAAGTAPPYLAAGLALLDGTDPWHHHFQLVFELTLERAHIMFYQGDNAGAVAEFEALLQRELSLPNTAAVYLQLIAVRVAEEAYEEASRVGIAALAAFGIQLALRPKRWQLVVAALAAMRKIGSNPERLLELPLSTSPTAQGRNQLAIALSFPFYFHDTNLSVVSNLKATPRMLDDGLDDTSGMQLVAYAISVHLGLKKPALARRFAKVGSELHQRLGTPRLTANLLFFQHQMIEPWHVPYRNSIEPFRLAVDKAADVGDYFHVVVCHVCRLCCALTEGVHLTRLERIGEEAHETSRHVPGVQSDIGVIVSLREVADQLRNQPVLDPPEDWFATPQLARLQRGVLSFHMVATAQLFVLILRGDHDQAYALADRLCPAIFTEATGVAILWIACVGLGVGAAIHMQKARGAARRRYRKQLAGAIKKLRSWAIHNPVFFDHKLRWLEAEQARAEGRTAEAAALYTRAHELALAAEYPHLAAAIDLRRGELALELGLPLEAAGHFQAAVAAHRAWGARALASHLEQRHAAFVSAPQPAASAAGPTTTLGDSIRTTGVTSAESLDFGALLSASQAIAQEVTLGSVLERVMSSTVASAGATFGALLLEQRGALTTLLKHRAGEKLDRCAIALDGDDDLPRSIIQYVEHSGEPLVLEDAAAVGNFTADPWVARRAARSILCAPIVKQSRRVGVLFLHNDLVSNAFTHRHLTILQMLSSQAAISIDNAILYDELSTLNRELEGRVEDRTRALREAQQLLVESARKAGMADVAVDVLHNVGNALNSINVSVQLVQSRVLSSKVKSLNRVVGLIGEHKHDLAQFLTEDARGSQIGTMLALLGDALANEQDSTLQELVELRANLDNVGAIVRELDATAEDKGVAALEAPHPVIDQAIALTRERCERAGVTLVTDLAELSSLAGARIDKHKALTIVVGLLGNALDALDAVPAADPRSADDAGATPDASNAATAADAPAPDKQLAIRLRGSRGVVEVQVSDNGIGIAREDLIRIFQGNYSTKPGRRGASLHRFANLAASAGGSLTVESRGLGQGACFTLALPDRAAARPDLTARVVRPTGSPPRGAAA